MALFDANIDNAVDRCRDSYTHGRNLLILGASVAVTRQIVIRAQKEPAF